MASVIMPRHEAEPLIHDFHILRLERWSGPRRLTRDGLLVELFFNGRARRFRASPDRPFFRMLQECVTQSVPVRRHRGFDLFDFLFEIALDITRDAAPYIPLDEDYGARPTYAVIPMSEEIGDTRLDPPGSQSRRVMLHEIAGTSMSVACFDGKDTELFALKYEQLLQYIDASAHVGGKHVLMQKRGYVDHLAYAAVQAGYGRRVTLDAHNGGVLSQLFAPSWERAAHSCVPWPPSREKRALEKDNVDAAALAWHVGVDMGKSPDETVTAVWTKGNGLMEYRMGAPDGWEAQGGAWATHVKLGVNEEELARALFRMDKVVDDHLKRVAEFNPQKNMDDQAPGGWERWEKFEAKAWNEDHAQRATAAKELARRLFGSVEATRNKGK